MTERVLSCRIFAVGLGAALSFGSATIHAGEGPAARGAAPTENSSYVPDDHDAIRRDWSLALAAIGRRDFTEGVRALQRVAEGPADAVILAGEPGVFDGAEIAAHVRVVTSGAACLEAYEHEFGAVATRALERAVAARDERRLAVVVEMYRPAEAGRLAALLLADLAIERADPDGALGELEGLEDLEEAAASDLEPTIAAWRGARLARMASALAKDSAARGRIALALARREGRVLDRGDLSHPRVAADWPTTGGDASRARVAPALGERLSHRSSELLYTRGPPPSPWGSMENLAPRPSLWIPTRAVVSGGRAFVSDGRSLRRFDIETGKPDRPLPYSPRSDPEALPPTVGRPSRTQFGWIEGHGLTVDGDRVYVTKALLARARAGVDFDPDATDPTSPTEPSPATAPPDALAPFALDAVESERADRVAAFRITDATLLPLWEMGGGIDSPNMPKGMCLYGTPLLYGGALHVAGLRPTIATRDRIEAWHVALDPATGEVRSATFLGTGGPVRRGRSDEAMPASCSAARGRIVIVTSLGIAAAVAARSGRTLWSYRYDRGRPDGDDMGHRLDEPKESTERKSSHANEPPILVDGRCFFAPTDSRHLFAIADRPRGRARTLRLWRRNRVDDFRNLAVEQIVGVVGEADADAPILVVAGQGYDGGGSPHTAVVGLDPATGAMRWERALPVARDPEPFGRAMLTAGEVYVSTRDGIARYRLADGSELPLLDAAAVAREGGMLDDAYERTFEPGNLIPIPGKGLVTVNTASISIWRRP